MLVSFALYEDDLIEFFFFSSRRRHTRWNCDWSSDVCSSDLDMLEHTKESKRQKDLDEEKARLRLIEEEKARDEYKRLIDQKRELELLFGQAQMYFEREQYRHCIEICDKILYINTNLTSVAEMRNVAQRLQHMKMSRENLKNYVEEWKRTFEQIELNAAVQADELEFPDMA